MSFTPPPLHPPTPTKNPQNQNFEEWKNFLEILSFYTCVPKITIIWCMVPDIQSEIDRIFCHFTPFFVLLPPIDSPNNPEKSKFWKKMKKMSGDVTLSYIHIYHKSTSYEIWFLKCKVRQTEFVVILDHFLLFYPLTTWKIKILKNWKKHHDISLFYNGVPKIMIICYTVPEIWRIADVTVIFHFGLSFAFLPP